MNRLLTAPTLDDALEGLASTVRANEKRGERTLVFCEDRLTLLAEHAVVGGTGGTFLTEVSTFRRFLSRSGKRKIATLSKQGSVLEIAALMAQYENELGCFKKSAAQAVYETIAQLSASCVDEGLLRMSAQDTDGVLQKKLEDLAFLFEKYHDFLHEKGLLDENGYLALLPAELESGAVRDVNVIFFAFPSFTRQAQAGIRAAMQHARSTTGIFLGGAEDFYTNEAARVFTRVAEEFGGVEEIKLPCSLQGAALAMHGCLFSAKGTVQRIGGGHVRGFTPTDENSEMETLAALIRKLTAEGKRYKDIAVLVSGQEYFLAVKKAFEAYRIPYYADVKRPFSEHPFCAFVLSVLEAAADGLLPDEADDIAASVYFGDDGNYRNYLLRYGGYRGGAKREIRSEEELGEAYGDRETLLSCREKMQAIFKLFKQGERAGAEYTEAIRKLWKLVEGEKVTTMLASSLPEEEKALLDITPLEGILRETEEVVGGIKFKPREFAQLLRSGLQALTVAILPQRADAVFVGDITDSKIRRADVLICAGLIESVPRVSQDTAVITDGEIERLGGLQVEIDPAIAVVNARARESLALNLCAFASELYLSCPIRLGGSEQARSEVFYYIDQTFDVAPMPEVFPYDCSEFAPAMLTFYRELDGLGTVKGDTAQARITRYSSIREALMNPTREEWAKCDPGQLRDGSGKPSTEEAGKLWFRREISPTALEDYFACPYKGFAMRALKVQERGERTLLGSADAGSFVHTVLERVAKSFNEITDEITCRERAASTAGQLLKEPQYASLTDTAAGRYTAGRLITEAASVTAACWRQLAESAYRVHKTEAEIVLSELKLRGKSDRVDAHGDLVRVIDYKTGAIDDTGVAYYTGRKLQLQLYLRAAAKEGRAAGAFYFPAADDFSAEGTDKFRMKGFYCKEPEVMEGMDTVRGEEKSRIFESGGTDRALPREKFEDFLDYAALVSTGAEREMSAGNITPSPYEGSCDYCKLKGMCGFTQEPRKEAGLKPAEIAEIVKRAREEEI